MQTLVVLHFFVILRFLKALDSFKIRLSKQIIKTVIAVGETKYIFVTGGVASSLGRHHLVIHR